MICLPTPVLKQLKEIGLNKDNYKRSQPKFMDTGGQALDTAVKTPLRMPVSHIPFPRLEFLGLNPNAASSSSFLLKDCRS